MRRATVLSFPLQLGFLGCAVCMRKLETQINFTDAGRRNRQKTGENRQVNPGPHFFPGIQTLRRKK
jgi:hypothetical protein